MEFVLTNGENKDFAKLCQLLDENLNEIVGGVNQRERYVQYNGLVDIHDVIILYDDHLIPIGCASFKYYEEGIAEVKRVFLMKEYRGQGLAKELMKRIEERAKVKGYKKLVLETGELFISALKLYQSLDYHIIENYGQYKCMSESVCMSKDL